jgi:uncharacterized membrane protein YhhN
VFFCFGDKAYFGKSKLMPKRHLYFSLIFLVLACLNIAALSDRFPGLNMLVKPLICISLAIYLMRRCKMRAGFNRLVLTALLFSCLGDSLLLFQSEHSNLFIYGLISFLLAHAAYSIAFFRDFKNDPQASKVFGHAMLFVMGVFSLSYYSLLRESLHALRMPVLAYIFVISIMTILAGYRYKRVNLLSFKLIFIGAIFFVASDSLLAYHKFVESFDYAGIAVMGTYMLAQYLIVMGVVDREVTPGPAVVAT